MIDSKNVKSVSICVLDKTKYYSITDELNYKTLLSEVFHKLCHIDYIDK